MWHQPEDARSVNSRFDTQSLGSRSNMGVRRRQPHQSPHHSLSRAFGDHVRRAYNRYERDHSDADSRHPRSRGYDDDRGPPSRDGGRRYQRRDPRPGEDRHRRHRRPRRDRDDRYHRDRSRDRQHRGRDRSDFEHNFNARMHRWMNGGGADF